MVWGEWHTAPTMFHTGATVCPRMFLTRSWDHRPEEGSGAHGGPDRLGEIIEHVPHDFHALGDPASHEGGQFGVNARVGHCCWTSLQASWQPPCYSWHARVSQILVVVDVLESGRLVVGDHGRLCSVNIVNGPMAGTQRNHARELFPPDTWPPERLGKRPGQILGAARAFAVAQSRRNGAATHARCSHIF